MNRTMKRIVRVGCLCAGLCGLSAGLAVSRQPPSPPGTTTRSLSEEKLRYEQALARLVDSAESALADELEMLARQAASDAAVDHARVALSVARYNQAISEGKVDAACDQVNSIIEIRQRELRRARMAEQAMASSPQEVRASERRLAHARYRLAKLENKPEVALQELREIVGILETEWKEISRSREATSALMVEVVRYNLVYARYRLARLEGKPEEAVGEARAIVELSESMHKRMIMIEQAGGSPFEEEIIRRFVPLARYHLAVANQNADGIRDELQKYVEVWEKIDYRVRTDPTFTWEDKAVVAHDLALLRLRLAIIASGGKVDDDVWEDFFDLW